jgi:hypothetical protein
LRRRLSLADVQCYLSDKFEADEGEIKVSWMSVRHRMYSAVALLRVCQLVPYAYMLEMIVTSALGINEVPPPCKLNV